MDDESDNLPPADLDAERCYLGALLIAGEDRDQQSRIRRSVRSKDSFLQPDHGIVFDVASRILDDGDDLDAAVLVSRLRARGQFEEIGGIDLIRGLLDTVPSWRHGETYGRRVESAAFRREAMVAGQRLAKRMNQPIDDETAEAVVRDEIDRLWSLGKRRQRVRVYGIADILDEFMQGKRNRKAVAMLTGIDALDRFAGVFSFGKYTVVAGRPSIGKSTLCRWLSMEWARAGTPVGVVSVEEDRLKVAGNFISATSELENDYVAYHDFNNNDFAQADDAVATIRDAAWFGCDSAFTLDEVSAAVDYLVEQKGCRVVVVDHLHLIKYEHRTENEQREIKEVSRRLKELAKIHNVVLIAAAQLSRPPDKQKMPPAPTLVDLRASGAIEEHADAVILLHREDYYRKQETPTNECELHIEKNRNGRRGVCVLKVDLAHQRFSSERDVFVEAGSRQEQGYPVDDLPS